MLTYRNGSHPINRLRDEMDRLFEGFAGDWSTRPGFDLFGARTFPPLNVWEDDQNVYAEAELPGLTMGDLELFVTGNELSIKGERKGHEDEKTTYHRRERGLGAFSRVVRLPVDVNADNVQASLRDGVLTIVLPKAEAARARKIEVKAITN